ncbi:hypothetical protein C1Y63_00855 [Corynebacterium sp. 13CS0277]|uniref:FAD-dependent oxidoreductase n=1 Tax=Corynebacterium sp. 13CS0277 TaxID=2071994 RepID=UPI000D0450BA|nr:FAD-dependent oxidoreductase [Corynebacterium sp. 13CS0277]PRQ12375.1 hypothetical protein C1Y63_00855 [Corynebacterium sp. 13CS0277]
MTSTPPPRPSSPGPAACTQPAPDSDAHTLPALDAEVIVVGGGAAGLSAALVLGRQQRMVIAIDSGDYRNAPSPGINMLPAANGIAPKDYVRRGRAALDAVDTVLRLHDHVTDAQVVRARDEHGAAIDAVEVRVRSGRVIRAARLILATGQHDHVSAIDGVAQLWGTKVLHCPYCHGFEARGGRIVVVHRADPARPGAGMVAAYQALYVRQRLSEHVVFVTDEEPSDEMAAALTALAVEVIQTRVTAITGDGDEVTVHAQGHEGIVADHVFFVPESSAGGAGLATSLGLETQGPSILVDDQQRTSNPVVFAAGDGAVPRGRPQAMTFVSQAQAQGQLAGLWADQDLFFAHPHTPPFPQT